MNGAHVIDVDEGGFERRVIAASRDRPVVVDFWAGWCRPCLILSPILERLADEYGGAFTLAKVDVDANQRLAARFRVQGIPAVKGFRDGAVAGEFVGVQPEHAIRRFLEELLPSDADRHVAAARAATAPEDAEAAYRKALADDPAHAEAVAGLADLLLRRGEVQEARVLLDRLPVDGPTRRTRAELDLHVLADGDGELAIAAAEALRGDHAAALDRCLRLISSSEADRDAARDAMLAMFAILGEGHPLTRRYRARLASALF